MKKINEQLAEILNDLIKINYDRIAGYEKAVDELADSDLDLQALFHQFTSNSKKYIKELSIPIEEMGAEVSTDSTVAGKIYRTWMDIKAAFTSDSQNRVAVLESCEYGEDAALSAYESALENSNVISDISVRELIIAQRDELEESHDIVRKYRDLQKEIS